MYEKYILVNTQMDHQYLQQPGDRPHGVAVENYKILRRYKCGQTNITAPSGTNVKITDPTVDPPL